MSIILVDGAAETIEPSIPSPYLAARRNHFCGQCGHLVGTIKYDERTNLTTVVTMNTEQEVLLSRRTKRALTPIEIPTPFSKSTLPDRPPAPSPSRQGQKQSPATSFESQTVPSLCYSDSHSEASSEEDLIASPASRKGSIYSADISRFFAPIGGFAASASISDGEEVDNDEVFSMMDFIINPPTCTVPRCIKEMQEKNCQPLLLTAKSYPVTESANLRLRSSPHLMN